MSSLRDELGRRVNRLRSFGFRDAVQIESDTFRRLVKATVAATASWEVADLLGSPRPVLASLGAVLVVQVTVRASLARSIQLMIGVTVGLGLSILIGHFLGLHWWSIGLIVLGGLVMGEILRLGPFSSQAAISALLAFSLGSGYGLLRIVDTVIGAAIGVLVNAAIAPPSYVADSAGTLRRTAEDIGGLLRDIGRTLADDVRPLRQAATADAWLERAREVSGQLHEAGEEFTRAEESVAFNHRQRRAHTELDRVGETRTALEHAGNQVRGVARTLSDLARSAPAPQVGEPAGAPPRAPADGLRAETDERLDPVDAVLSLLGPLLEHGGDAVAAFGRLAERPDSTPDREDLTDAVRAAREARDEAATALADLDTHLDTHLDVDIVTEGRADALSARLLASILVDGERLVDEVAEHGAHAAALVTPG